MQDHRQNQQYLFIGLQGRPHPSYKNCQNYEIFENCKIYCILQDQQQNLRYLFTGLQGKPLQSYENCENYKIDENEENVL